MAKPFVKWVGGKNKLLPELKGSLPESYNRFIELFVGGGAFFLDVEKGDFVINDLNKFLINVYIQVKEDKYNLMSILDSIESNFNKLCSSQEKSDYYYFIRAEYNKRINVCIEQLNVTDAAYFIFLNKLCFNGLYRVNSSGYFNVPFGKKEKVKLYSYENIVSVSEILQITDINCGDFEKIGKKSVEGDFVFIDSPYYNTYDKYQSDSFKLADHQRLYKLFKSLSDKGVYCLLTNSNTDYIKDLYKQYNITEIDVIHAVNCKGNNRHSQEIIIKNY